MGSITKLFILAGNVLLMPVAAFGAPYIAVDHPIVDFEVKEVAMNTNWVFGVDIFNHGTTDLHIGDIDAALDPPFSLTGTEDCLFATLRPSEQCDFNVNLRIDQTGEFATEIDIASDDPVRPILTIVARARVVEYLLAGRLDGLAAPVQLRCFNRSTGQEIRQQLKDPSDWDCGRAGLQADTFDFVSVSMLGRAEIDTPPAMRWNEPMGPPELRLDLSAGRSVRVDPPVLWFGSYPLVTMDGGLSLDVRNVGDAPVFINRVSVEDRLDEPFFVNTERCAGKLLEPGGSCNSIFGFHVSEGVFFDTFSITTDDPATPLITVPVFAEGVADVIAGTSEGMRSQGRLQLVCENLTTGQVVVQTSRERWNCTDSGFQASEGDQILIWLGGLKD